MRTFPRVASLLLLGMLFGSRPSLAHEPPLGRGVWWVSGDAGERIIIETNRGLLVSTDDGATFRFLCDDVLGGAASEALPLTASSSGQISIATFGSGLLSSSADMCTWQATPIAGAQATMPTFDVLSVSAGQGQPAMQYALAGTAASTTGLFVRRDGGGAAAWQAVGASTVAYTRIRAAPSAPSRLYQTGIALGADGKFVHELSVSEDGGMTTTEWLVPLGVNELQARILQVDPRDPDRIYLHVEATSLELPERLIVSADGGRNFTTALTLVGFNAFALSPDGGTVWAGGSDGLWRSVDRGEHFIKMETALLTRLGCLGYHNGRLLACGVTGNDFSISVSTDEGESFRRLLAFSQVEDTIDCPATSQVSTTCRGPMIHWRQEVVTPPAVTAGGTGGTVNPRASVPMRSTGCDVVSSHPSLGAAFETLLLLTAAWSARRSRPSQRFRCRSGRSPPRTDRNHLSRRPG